MDAAEAFNSTQRSNFSHCQLATDFQVDFGALDIVGPVQTQEDSTCISGRACNVWHIKGHLMDSAPGHFLILDTCSMPMRTPTSHFGQGHGNRSVVFAGNISSPSFVLEDVPEIGGEYRLCWCGPNAAGGACSAEAAFTTDAGQVFVLGPRPLQQDRTCIAGRSCMVEDILGFGLSSKMQAMILDTCGVASFGVGIATAGTTMANRSSFVWEKITAKGGQYRMCWCADTEMVALASIPAAPEMSSLKHCANPEDFNVDFGRLDLLGPHHVEQSFTCVSGQSCVLKGFQYDMSLGDSVLVLDTCGKGTSLVPHWLQEPAFALPVNWAFSWGSIRHTPQGGEYRLCWCSKRPAEGAGSSSNMTDGSPCQAAEHFAVDFGSLRMIGPVSTHTRTCVVGYPCWIAGLEGKDLQELSLASRGLPGPSFNLTRYNQSACLQSDFRVDVGALHIVGPRTGHAFTCISGLTCSVSSVEGLGLTSNDSYIILDTCGIPTSVPRFSSAGEASLSADGTVVSWGEAVVSAAGGEYRLCWCKQIDVHSSHNYTSSCESPTNFLSDVGTLLLIGVDLEQPRTCVSGSTCMIDGIKGTYLQDGDALLVLDTCGLGRAPPNIYHVTGGKPVRAFENISGHAWYLDVTETPILGGFPDDANVVVDVQDEWVSTARISWNAPVTSHGGTYRLCWCSRAGNLTNATHQCSRFDSFIDAGKFEVLGPSGQISWRPTQRGRCGERTAFPETKVLDTFDNFTLEECRAQCDQLHPLCQVGWYSDRGRNEGQCKIMQTCVSIVDDSEPTILLLPHKARPGSFQPRTCISGQMCTIGGLLGNGLKEDDSYMLLETCGFADALVDKVGKGGVALLASKSNSTGVDISWESPISAAGGTYRLCWCGADASCSSSESFRTDAFAVDIGELVMRGPLFGFQHLQMRTCISGQACEIDGLDGSFLDGFVLIMDSCGTEEAFARRSPNAAQVTQDRVSWAMLSAQGGQYQLCWCSGTTEAENSSNISQSDCLSSPSFTIHFGSLTLVGPYAAHEFTCVSGQSCAISGVWGQGLDVTNEFLVLETCGTPSPLLFGPAETVPPWIPVANRTSVIDEDWSWASYDRGNLSWAKNQSGLQLGCSTAPNAPDCRSVEPILGVAWREPLAFVSAGTYQLCWCAPTVSTPSERSCDRPESFRISAGSLTMRGPLSNQDRTCVSGQTCAFGGIYGLYIHEDDRFMILETCGSPFLPAGLTSLGMIAENYTLEEGINFTATNISESDTVVRVSWAPNTFSGPGGKYRLCWCAAGFECDEKNGLNFRTDVGALYLLGPSPSFDEYDKWLRGSCSNQHRTSLQINMSKEQCFSLARYASPEVVAAEFESQGNMLGSCSLLSACESFSSTDGSGLEVIFVRMRAAQHRTCVSGLACSVDAIEGLGLTAADSFVVADTCGQPSIVKGFPSNPTVREIADPSLVNTSNYTVPWAELQNCKSFSVCYRAFYIHLFSI
eukprot:Skav220466  [mRNA]  locus=scaffold3371:141367:147052:- [translate_table: standard]